MSREDPQLRIRLPVELKEKVEEAAKANGRSINAEIVHRLDVSFLKDIPTDQLISAKEAIQIVNKAKDELSGIIFERTFTEINKKIRLGHTSFFIDLDDLELDGISEDDFSSLFSLTFNRLNELGYAVSDRTWDVGGFLVEIPE
ncbi:Arc-like DNA binding domain [Buttiauxella agrestis]|uniref:Arc-like DNA binding domain n=1 Tax=Buttiauxella agrestis TaxID=82977 RepID=A0A381C8X6_9ENTR|nr:Arc family DNA-binding protein [Buttiauxella agrestis]SUW64325.1 Arc-like DNA binding domain [Buttiauxella agrestis]